MQTDKSWRVIIDISKDQVENIQDIILQRMAEGVYSVTIEPEIISAD